MKTKTIYIKINQKNENDYCSVDLRNYKTSAEEIKEDYEETLEVLKDFNINYNLSFEEFSKKYIQVNVKYDGRKNYITESDVYKVLLDNNIVELASESGFLGGYYRVKDFSKIRKGYYEQ